MCEKPNKDKHLVKYSIFGFTFQSHYIPNIAFFKKTKSGPELVSPPHFLHNF